LTTSAAGGEKSLERVGCRADAMYEAKAVARNCVVIAPARPPPGRTRPRNPEPKQG
jgi:hypothetical protein